MQVPAAVLPTTGSLRKTGETEWTERQTWGPGPQRLAWLGTRLSQVLEGSSESSYSGDPASGQQAGQQETVCGPHTVEGHLSTPVAFILVFIYLGLLHICVV